MKIRLQRANWVLAMAMLALPATLITSCSKENKTEIVDSKGQKLTISVAGINESQQAGQPGAKASASHKGRAGSADEAADAKLFQFPDVDLALSVGNSLPAKQSRSVVVPASRGKFSGTGARAAAEMDQGIKYVVYIYEGANLVASKELSAGTSGTIDGLDATKTYRWVAVSHNSENTAPSLSPSAGSLEIPQDTDLLFASGNLSIATDPNLAITFDHALSRIGIELNTIGIFGEITGSPTVTVTGLSLAAGSIDLMDGSITPGASYEPVLSYADFQNVDPDHEDAKIAYVYTASSAQQNITVNVQNLTIQHVDQGASGAVVTTNRTYFANGAEFTSGITPEVGKSSHLLLNVIESPLVTTYGGNTVKWARSNLYYRGNNGGGRNYAFYANNAQGSRADGYFGFGGTVAGTFATTSTSGDPCALVYPEGTWRQPRNTDFNNMVNGQGLLTNLLGNILGGLLGGTDAPNAVRGANYVEYTLGANSGAPTSGSNAFGNANSTSNKLRFYYNGQINNVAVLTEIGQGGGLLGLGLNDLSVSLVGQTAINLGVPLLDSYGNLTALWTNEQVLNLLGLVGTGTWGYLGATVDPLLAREFVTAQKTAELLNGVSALNIDVLSTTMKNVRCVRN